MTTELGTMLAAHRLDQERRGSAPSTIYRRASDVRAFARWLDPHPISTASEDDVQRFLDGRRISSRTRYAYLSNLHCFYESAQRAGLADHDPTAGILRPRLPRCLPRPIADSDLTVALDMAGTVMRAWLTLAAYAGLRCAEIGRLQRADVIEAHDLIRVLGKGNKERLVPLHPEVARVLRVAGMPRTGHLFRRPRGGPYPAAMISREVSLFLHGLNIDATAHQLRHWFGTKTYAACQDLRVVQELMGHSDPKTTAGYAAFSHRGAQAAVMALSVTAELAA